MVRWVLCGVAAVILVGGAVAQDEPLSSRNASYRIDVRLDAEAKRLAGSQVLTWRNIQDQPTDELQVHLYWNGWRNDHSTWMLEDRLRGRNDHDEKKEIEEGDWSWTELDSVRLLPAAGGGDSGVATGDGDAAQIVRPTEEIDLTAALRYAAPDDGNPADRTVVVIKLPFAVAPGESVRVAMDWRSKIPRTFARTGFRGDFFMVAHWFPAIGVFDPEGWNTHQYHAATEYYSDYGEYDVRMTVPSAWVLGATGKEVERTDNGDGTTTHRYVQDDVHTFTWTTSPDYQVHEAMFDEPGLPRVAMRLLMQPEHLTQTERHFEATRAALKYYGTWYGPYPYDHVTVIDPAWGSGAGGMEYPTLFTSGTRLFNPLGGGSPEGVTVHEAGHQFWYGIVGNNEFEHAWIDEGFNTFSTGRTMKEAYGDSFLVRRFLPPPKGSRRGSSGFFPLAYPDIKKEGFERRLDSYRSSAISDDPITATYLYHPATGGNISYSKTALWLMTLENHLGWETLQPILSTFFTRYSFRHPRPADFVAVAEEVSGRDLSWFFDQILHDSVSFDYAVTGVSSVPAAPRGFVDQSFGSESEPTFSAPPKDEDEDKGPDDDPDTRYRTEVVVERRGQGVFPVEVLMVFEGGHEQRETWDGVAHWKTFTVDRPAKLNYAAVDPDRVLMLDIDYTNNSRVREPEGELAAYKWASKWMLWAQDLMSTFAFFI